MTIHEAIGNDLASLGGFLRCEVCGVQRGLGDTGRHLAYGWPKHCGHTMMWWTARQIAAGEVPRFEQGHPEGTRAEMKEDR